MDSMTLSNNVLNELHQNVIEALINVGKIVEAGSGNHADLLQAINLFLLAVVSTAADMMEVVIPGGGAWVFADVEAGAKQGGLRSISNALIANGSFTYSVSDIEEDDLPTAMNYLGQQLLITLMKGMHELPLSLRKPETQLRGIEALLANLLNGKFHNPHDILNSFCEHVHRALDDLRKPSVNKD